MFLHVHDGEYLHVIRPMFCQIRAFQVAQWINNLPAIQETWVQSLGPEDPLEKEVATHSNIRVWEIPWTEESGEIQPVGSKSGGHMHDTACSGLVHWDDPEG